MPFMYVNSVLGVLGEMFQMNVAFLQVPMAFERSCSVTLCPKQMEVTERLFANILKSAVNGLSTRTVFSISDMRVQPSVVLLNALKRIFQQPIPPC